MNSLGNRQIAMLIVGGVLLIGGAGFSLAFKQHGPLAAAAVVAIICGLALIRFSNFVSNRHRPATPRKSGDWIAGAIYVPAAVAFLVVIASGLLGYFNDWLTYSFAAVFAAAVIVRLFRIFT